MNIFWLEYNEDGGPDPWRSAFSCCDRHVVNQIKESANMLAWLYKKELVPFARTHRHHPCTEWTLAREEHYRMHGEHAMGLCAAYTERYHKKHVYEDFIRWAVLSIPIQSRRNPEIDAFSEIFDSPPPIALGLKDHPERKPLIAPYDVVATYRNYYKACKAHFAAWTHGHKPSWWDSWPNLLEEKDDAERKKTAEPST